MSGWPPGVEVELVPAHLRQPEAGCLHRRDLALDPAEAGCLAVLQAALRHQLHADADAEERRARAGRILQRGAQARNRRQSVGAIGEGTLPGQHDAVGAPHPVRIGGHPYLNGQAGTVGRLLQRARSGGEVAALVVDDGDPAAGMPHCLRRAAHGATVAG